MSQSQAGYGQRKKKYKYAATFHDAQSVITPGIKQNRAERDDQPESIESFDDFQMDSAKKSQISLQEVDTRRELNEQSPSSLIDSTLNQLSVLEYQPRIGPQKIKTKDGASSGTKTLSRTSEQNSQSRLNAKTLRSPSAFHNSRQHDKWLESISSEGSIDHEENLLDDDSTQNQNQRRKCDWCKQLPQDEGDLNLTSSKKFKASDLIKRKIQKAPLSFNNFTMDCKQEGSKISSLDKLKNVQPDIEDWDSDELAIDNLDEVPEFKGRDDLYIKALASDTISESTATPIDEATMIQVFRNPNDAQGLIMVQKLEKCIHSQSKSIYSGDNEFKIQNERESEKKAFNCKNGHKFVCNQELRESNTESKDFQSVEHICSICERTMAEKQKFYQCTDGKSCNDNLNCFECILSEYVDNKIFQKTKNHRLSNNYCIDEEIVENQHRLNQQSSQSADQSTEFAIISLWQMQRVSEDQPPNLECVSQFEIKDPVFLPIDQDTSQYENDKEYEAYRTRQKNKLAIAEFLFVGASQHNQNEFYFFTHARKEGGSKKLKLWLLDFEESKASDVPAHLICKCNYSLEQDLLKVLGINKETADYYPSIISWPEIHNNHIVVKGLSGQVKNEQQTELDSALTNVHIYNINSKMLKPSFAFFNVAIFINFSDVRDKPLSLWFTHYDKTQQHLKICMHRNLEVDNHDSQTQWVIDPEVQQQIIQQIIMTKFYGLPHTVVSEIKQKPDAKRLYQVIFAFDRINMLNKLDEEKQQNFMKFKLDPNNRKKVKYASDSNLNEAFLFKISTTQLFSIDSLEIENQETKKNPYCLNTTRLVTGNLSNLSYLSQQTDVSLNSTEIKFQIDHHTQIEKILNQNSQPRKLRVLPLVNNQNQNQANWPFSTKKNRLLAACFFEDERLKTLKLSIAYVYKAQDFQLQGSFKIMHQKSLQVSYPILAHLGPQPLANYLYIANLVQNKPQSRVDLSPKYKFVCFFEAGTHQPHAFEDMMTQSIFFLARQQDSKFSVLSINLNPWLKDQKPKIFVIKKDIKLPSLNEGLQIKHAMLFKNSFSRRMTLFVKSIIGTMFAHEGGDRNVRDILPLISLPRIDWFQFIVQDQKYSLVVYDPDENDEEKQTSVIKCVIPTQAVSGFNQDCYYVKYNQLRDNFQLIQMVRGPPSSKILHIPVYESKCQIIYIQEQNFQPTSNKEQAFKLILLDFDYCLKVLTPSKTNDGLEILNTVQLRKTCPLSQSFFSNLREQHLPQNVVVEPEVITANNYMFRNKGTHLSRFSIGSENLIEGIDMCLSNLEQEPAVKFIQQVPEIGKEIFLLSTKKKNYFLTQDKGNQRHIDIMDCRNTGWFISKMFMTEYRIFALCDHSRSLNFLQTDTYCIEFDRQSLMMVNCYNDVCQLKISKETRAGPQYVMLQDKLKKKVQIIQCNKICQDCTPQSIMVDSNFDLALELKQIEEREFSKLSKQQGTEAFGNYIFTENGNTIYAYFLRRTKDENSQKQDRKNQKQKKQSNQIFLTKLNGLQKIKEVYKFEGQIFDSLQSTSSAAKNKFYILMTGYYVVLRVGCRIFFFTKKQLLRDSKESDKKINEKNVQSKFIVKNASEIPMENLNSWEKAKNALQISNVPQAAYKFFDLAERSTDLIQISMEDQIIIWNLRKNEEIVTKKNFEKFCNVENFVDQGISLFKTTLKKIESNGQQYTHMWPFQTNRQRSAYLIPSNTKNNELGAYFKPFTRMGVIETMHLESQNDEDRSVETVAHSSLVSDVYGVTIFEKLYFSNIPELAVARMTDKTLQTIVCQLILRPTTRAFKLIEDNSQVQAMKGKGMRFNYRRNILQKCLRFLVVTENIEDADKITRRTEKFLELFANQESINMSDVVSSVREFWQLYYTMADLKGTKYFTMQWRKQIMFGSDTIDVQWLIGKKMISFGAYSSDMNENEIRRQIKFKQKSKVDDVIQSVRNHNCKEFLRKYAAKIMKIKCFRKKYVVTEVRVRKYKIDWLSQDEKELYKLVAESDDTDLFGDVFICDLLLNNDLSTGLFLKAMLPYIIQMGTTLYFYIELMSGEQNNGYFGTWAVIFSCMGWMMYLELEQLKQYGLLYFSDFWNLLNFVSNVLVTLVFCFDVTGNKGIHQTLCASISGFLLTITLFYWSQMFKNVSMYFRIILDSVVESRYFLMMVFVMIISFSNAVYILDQDQQNLFRLGVAPVWSEEYQNSDYIEMTHDKTENEIIDSFFTEYLLMLGEFEILNSEGLSTYPKIVNNLLWCYFFLATFMTQVVFFNVLVAVIGESYAEKWANKDKYALQQTATIYGDYIANLDTNLPQNQFIYIVQPQNQEDLEQHTKMLNQITKMVSENHESSEYRINDLDSKIETLHDSHDALKKELRDGITTVNSKIDRLIAMMDKRNIKVETKDKGQSD